MTLSPNQCNFILFIDKHLKPVEDCRDDNGAGRVRRMGSLPPPYKILSCPIPAPPYGAGLKSCPIPIPPPLWGGEKLPSLGGGRYFNFHKIYNGNGVRDFFFLFFFSSNCRYLLEIYIYIYIYFFFFLFPY